MPIGHSLKLQGLTFGCWIVESFSHVYNRKRFFLCKCSNCSFEKIFCGTFLVQGRYRECNCINPPKKTKNSLTSGYNKFVIKNTIGCWGWKGCAPANPGYGQFRYNMKLERAHRASWIIHFGEIPNGMHVLHRCDNRICSNPEHLFLGTNLDNINDMIAKGRHPTLAKKGEQNHMASLKEEVVRNIKELFRQNKTISEISSDLGVPKTSICHISQNKTWRFVQ